MISKLFPMLAGCLLLAGAGFTDLRGGFTRLSAAVQTALQAHPFGGHAFVFRSRRTVLCSMNSTTYFCLSILLALILEARDPFD